MVRLASTRRFSVFHMLDIKEQEYRGRVQLDREADNAAFDSIFLNTDALNIDENRRNIISIDDTLEMLPNVSIGIVKGKGYEALLLDLQGHYKINFPKSIVLTKEIKSEESQVGSVIMDHVTQKVN